MNEATILSIVSIGSTLLIAVLTLFLNNASSKRQRRHESEIKVFESFLSERKTTCYKIQNYIADVLDGLRRNKSIVEDVSIYNDRDMFNLINLWCTEEEVKILNDIKWQVYEFYNLNDSEKSLQAQNYFEKTEELSAKLRKEIQKFYGISDYIKKK